MAALILLVIVVAIVLWMIGAYNRLISLKNQVANAWKQIDVQLKRRHDSDSEPREHGQGSDELRADHARGGHQRAEQGVNATRCATDGPGRG